MCELLTSMDQSATVCRSFEEMQMQASFAVKSNKPKILQKHLINFCHLFSSVSVQFTFTTNGQHNGLLHEAVIIFFFSIGCFIAHFIFLHFIASFIPLFVFFLAKFHSFVLVWFVCLFVCFFTVAAIQFPSGDQYSFFTYVFSSSFSKQMVTF